jgi:hypothetical protein
MTKIKNVSPFGDLDVPLLGRIFKAGEILDVEPEQAETLLRQVDNFQAWGPAAHKVQDKALKADAAVQDSGEGVAPLATPEEGGEAK